MRRASDNSIVLAASTDSELKFPTAANTVYVVERTAKPLDRYAYAHMTGTPNQGVKAAGTPCRLGN